MGKLLRMHLSDEQLDAYLLGSLSAEEENDIEEHYLSCPNCVSRLSATEDFIWALRAGLGELPRLRQGSPATEPPPLISTTRDPSAALQQNTRELIKELMAKGREFMGAEPSPKTLRADLRALGDLYSQIENLKGICREREEILLETMVQSSGTDSLGRIIEAYRSACSSREPPWDNYKEIRERACFWFHIGRLRLACTLWRLRAMPRLCCSLALQSLKAIEALTPGVLESVQAGWPQGSSGSAG